MSYEILISPVQYADNPPDRGEFFEVLWSDGTVRSPNGIHIKHSCEGTRNNYITRGIQVAEDMVEFSLLKDWYLKIMPNIIFSIANGIEFEIKGQMEDLISSFPESPK